MGLVNFPPLGHTVTPGMALYMSECVCLSKCVCSDGLCECADSVLGEIILRGEVGVPRD